MNNDNIFTIEDDEFIEKYYLVKTDDEIADLINKTKSQIMTRRLYLGFKKQRQTFLDIPDGMKWCWYCSELHTLDYFSKNKNKPDGLQDQCKIAFKDMQLKRKAKKKSKNKNGTKPCSKCNKEKPFSHFIINVSTNDGYSNMCKECLNEFNNTNRFKIKETK